jgi:hypothetical protein
MALDEAETPSVDDIRPTEEESGVSLVVESAASLIVTDAIVVDANDAKSSVLDVGTESLDVGDTISLAIGDDN